MHPITRSAAAFVFALFAFTFAVVQWPYQKAALQTNPAIAVVSAGNYQTPVTPEGIAALFGQGLATQTVAANVKPLPTSLGGVTVRVNNVTAPLFFVSAGQINFLVPAGTANGTANISVTASDGSARTGSVEIANAAPALFTFNANGSGVAAALALRVKANNAQSYEPIAQFDNATGRWQAVPLNLGPEGERLFLVLYASGSRNVASTLRVLMGGVEVTPSFAGASPDFFGVEQINVELTRALIGRGRLNLSLIAPNTRASNTAEIDLGFVASGDLSNAPKITNITPAQAIASETLTITGTGFSTAADGNAVIIGGVETRTVESATATQLVVRVPHGIDSGKLAIRTAQGEGTSVNTVNALTTVSGIITDTQGNPLPNAQVYVNGVVSLGAATRNDGSYTIKGIPAGLSVLRVDASALPLTPKLPVTARSLGVLANRDNLQAPIALQPPSNNGTNVQTQNNTPSLADENPFAAPRAALAPQALAASVTSGGLTFELPDNAIATLPAGVTEPRIYLTRIENSRAPFALPRGLFSLAIAQLSPYGINLNPGGKLIFPNADGLPANAQVALYRLNQTSTGTSLGSFAEVGTATVTADGQRIETAANAITETSIYFVAQLRPTTTVIGRVVDSDNKPVRFALIACAGQLALTDGNGSFVILNVAVPVNAQLSVEAAFIRPTGRTDRVTRTGITAQAFSLTRLTPDLVLPSPATQPNRPPSLTAPSALTINESTTRDFAVLASDPDANQTVTVTVSGAAFASIVSNQGAFTLRLAPGAATAGNYTLTLRATDSQNASTTQTVALTVIGNRPPVLFVPGAQTVQVGQTLSFTVSAIDPDEGQTLSFTATSLPTGAAFNVGATRQFIWTPSAAQIGNVTVSFRVSDNGLNSLSDTKTVTISVVGQFAQTNGPYGGSVTALLVNGTNLFAGTGSGGVFLSTNNGQSWAAVNNGLTNQFVGTLAMSGSNLFAGTNGGVFLSTNNGQSWTRVSNGLPSPFVDALLVSGSNLFAGTDGGGVFLSTNNGQSWTAVNNGLTNQQVHALAVSGSNLFAGTFGGGVFLSTNNGQSWSAVNNGLTDQFVQAFTMSGSNLFAGTFSEGVFLSTNNGQSWTAVNNGLTTPQVYALAVSGSNLFAGTNAGGVFLSTNNGQSWAAINNGLPFQQVSALAVSGSNLFAGTDGGGVFLSTNNGQNWVAINNGLTTHYVSALAVSGNNLFAGTDGGVYLSTNNGQSWTRVSNGLPPVYVYALTVSGSNLFAGTNNGGVYLSTNNGQSWVAVNNGLANQQVLALAVSGSNLFAGTDGGGVYLSTNNGQSWTAVNNGLTTQHVYDLVVSGSNLFAGTFGGGVFLSTNNGQSWAAVNNGLTNQLVTALTVSGSNLFAGTFGGVFLSTNNGQSWTAVNNGLTNRVVFALAVSGSNLFAGVGNFLGGGIGGVFLSTNSGQSWTAVNNGLPNQDVFALAVSGNRIFAGTRGSSVFVAQF